ncbi:hypothetical protein [Actinoplanes awajinensis]|uniref:Uncharacterized protein n=1 Tax=Actinoplanes awajinensis subsp. mycoplanecinus TaxID=135947 RepID=A0A117MRB7_9ACTN|nr:hypothetical protein [Actinoplanes awajinensis]KUL31419.1 hypothetical protein ADL15_22035 [Actinoplanes awajinensis subsp. mycoplanecinus]
MPRYWFRLDDVAPLTAHAIGCEQHTTTRAEALAGANNGPALVFASTRDGATLRSNGNPAWYDHDGSQHCAYATAWRHAPTGRTSHVHLSDYVHAFLPLTGQIMHLIHTARRTGDSWISVHIDSRDQHLISAYAIRTATQRDSIVPAGCRWRPAHVTCPETGSVAYPAQIPDGYTTTAGHALPRFDRDTIAKIAADLDRLRAIDARPGAYPILRLRGDDLTVLEEQTYDGNWTWRQVDRLRPDRAGYFPLGAYQWSWETVTRPSPLLATVRRALTAVRRGLPGHARSRTGRP